MRSTDILHRLPRVALPALLLVAATACDSNPAAAPQAAALADISSAAAYPIHLREVTLPSGVRLQYAETGKPDGEPIILLHGYTDSWFSYSRVLPLLAPRYRAIAITQRGHGDSDRPGSYTGGDFAADVEAFMQAWASSGRRWWGTRWAASSRRRWRSATRSASRSWCWSGPGRWRGTR